MVGIRSVCLSLCLMVGLSLAWVPASGAQEDTFNVDATRISVYDFNIHKMEGRWEDWVRDIDTAGIPKPDIILLQDLPNRRGRLAFQSFLGETWGDTWYGRAGVQGGTGWHTAIVWRAGRFESPKSRGWWGFGDPNNEDTRSVCVDGADNTSRDVPNGAPAVQVRLHDKIADRYVSAVSFKTPPSSPDDCPLANTQKVNSKLTETGWLGGILVMGTDANSRDWDVNADGLGRWRCWYLRTNGEVVDDPNTTHDETSACPSSETRDFSFRDPIFHLCRGDRTCLEGHATRRQVRIDFIFAKLRDGSMPRTSEDETETATLPRGGANGPYSDHRAIRTMIYY